MAVYLVDYENIKCGALNGISLLEETDRVILFYSENANRMTFDLHQRLTNAKAVVEYREVPVGGHNALDFQLSTYLGYLIANDRDGQFVIISSDRGFEYVSNFWRKEGFHIGVLSQLKDPAFALQQTRLPQETAEKTVEAAKEEPEEAAKAKPEETLKEEPEEAAKDETVLTVKPAKAAQRRKKAPKQNVKAVVADSPADLQALLEDIISEEADLLFVESSIEKYKTKLGLNNALVKKFGNQKAGSLYQRLKPLLSGKKGR